MITVSTTRIQKIQKTYRSERGFLNVAMLLLLLLLLLLRTEADEPKQALYVNTFKYVDR